MAITKVESRVLGDDEASLAKKTISDGALKLELGTNLVDFDLDGAPEVINVNNSPDGYLKVEIRKIADCKCHYSGLPIFGVNSLICSTGDDVSYIMSGNVKFADNETIAGGYYLFLDKSALGERTYKMIAETTAGRVIESTIETQHSVVRNDIRSNIGMCGLPSEDEIINMLEDSGYSINREGI